MASEKRLIELDVAKKLFDDIPPFIGMTGKCVQEMLDGAPRVDAVEVVHGEWSTIEDDYCGWTALQCSVCKQEYFFEDEPPLKIYNYCPNCGAKMDGDGNG